MKKQISAILLCLFLLINYSGCAGKGSSTAINLKEADIELWTTYAAQKVMQKDANTAAGSVISLDELYGGIKQPPKISVSAVKNEYEFAQIIITPSKNVKYYDAVVADLTAPSGELFSKTNIEVYNQKYIQTFNQSNTPKVNYEGWYPDALLPFSSAKKHGENTIKAGENQGLVFDVFVPSDTPAGVYSGSLELDFKAFKKKVPIEVNVLDYTLSEVTHSRSIFLHDWFLERGELDATQEMLDLYTDALSKYRLSPWKLINEQDWRLNASDIPLFVEKAYEYSKQDKNSTFCIPYRQVIDVDTNLPTIDKELFKDTLRQLIKKSFEMNFNILTKAACYFSLIDEPAHSQETEKLLPGVCNAFKTSLTEVSQELKSDSTIKNILKTEIIESINDIRNVVTTKYYEKFEQYIDTWCSYPSDYETESKRSSYQNQEERWWYTALSPVSPYANYHIESNLNSPRLLSWMAADYDVTGNLYWSSNMYSTLSNGRWQPLEDYYSTANRWPSTNGDGYLLYPGKKYGIAGPVPSSRILSIRDGNEDYEVLYDIKKQYSELSLASEYNFTSDNILRLLYDKLYSGASILTTFDKFISCRSVLIDLAAALYTDAKMCVLDYKEQGGTITLKVAVKQDHSLYYNQEKVTSGYETKGNGENALDIYTISKPLSSDSFKMSLAVKQDGVFKSVNLNAGGGSAQILTPDEFKDSTVVSGGNAQLKDDKIAVNFNNHASNKTQTVTLSHNYIRGIGAETEKIVLDLYANENVEYSVMFEYISEPVYYAVAAGTMHASGAVSVTVSNLFAYNWSSLKAVKNIHIRFGKQGDTARTIMIGNIYIYSEQKK